MCSTLIFDTSTSLARGSVLKQQQRLCRHFEDRLALSPLSPALSYSNLRHLGTFPGTFRVAFSVLDLAPLRRVLEIFSFPNVTSRQGHGVPQSSNDCFFVGGGGGGSQFKASLNFAIRPRGLASATVITEPRISGRATTNPVARLCPIILELSRSVQRAKKI